MDRFQKLAGPGHNGIVRHPDTGGGLGAFFQGGGLWRPARNQFLSDCDQSQDILIEVTPGGIPGGNRVGHFISRREATKISKELLALANKTPEVYASLIKFFQTQKEEYLPELSSLTRTQRDIFGVRRGEINYMRRAAVLACLSNDEILQVLKHRPGPDAPPLPAPRTQEMVADEAYRWALFSFGDPKRESGLFVMPGESLKLQQLIEIVRKEFHQEFKDKHLLKFFDFIVRMAVEAHQGQTRKSGEMYVVHPLLCALTAIRVEHRTPEIIFALLLHDILEDQAHYWKAEGLPKAERDNTALRHMHSEFVRFARSNRIPRGLIDFQLIEHIVIDLSVAPQDQASIADNLVTGRPVLVTKEDTRREFIDRFFKNPQRIAAKLIDILMNTRDQDFSSAERIRRKNAEYASQFNEVVYRNLKTFDEPTQCALYALEREYVRTGLIADNRGSPV